MYSIVSRKHSLLATAIAVSFAAAIGSAFADSGNLSSGNADVNKVFGRSSTSPVSGQPIRTSGLSNESLGRSTGHGNRSLSQNVASRPIDGALYWAGRGSQPIYAAHSKRESTAQVTAKGQ